ncbi:MAG: phenylalanine--tRNA ligase subunit alpha [Bacteroidales bacterium]|nr:phenylalanine--tRNA ligase subunit alpha [Bacteroidales bacterium]MBP5645661.1 phenylalanine--tRNA ligase subunit alpha [Bacteroidales bacterium]
MLKDKIQEYINDIQSTSIEKFQDKATEVEMFRVKYLGKKGIISDLFEQFKSVPNEEKKDLGKALNQLKVIAMDKIEEFKAYCEQSEELNNTNDLSLPADFTQLGSRHVLSVVMNEITEIFARLGFTVAESVEIEDDWHLFSALNFPPDHPARDMQDTFFVEKEEGRQEVALRTHTSSVQVRVMESQKPPIRIIAPGRVFRNEAISARAHCIFHQVEALYVDKHVSFADLKQTLLYFAKEMFGAETQIRLRPSYFPFTEPSAEMDISCGICGGKGCNICKGTGWLEILGCGMVDPNVLQACGIDPTQYSGFALGMGVERMAMLKYQIRDLRLYFENDLRFLKQFEAIV